MSKVVDLDETSKQVDLNKRISKNQVDLNKYKEFVAEVTSKQSGNSRELVRHIEQLENVTDVNIALLLTCLLYTSPSPRDKSSSRMPSSA